MLKQATSAVVDGVTEGAVSFADTGLEALSNANVPDVLAEGLETGALRAIELGGTAADAALDGVTDLVEVVEDGAEALQDSMDDIFGSMGPALNWLGENGSALYEAIKGALETKVGQT